MCSKSWNCEQINILLITYLSQLTLNQGIGEIANSNFE